MLIAGAEFGLLGIKKLHQAKPFGPCLDLIEV